MIRTHDQRILAQAYRDDYLPLAFYGGWLSQNEAFAGIVGQGC
ncbi:MAG: hypothetical protein QW514_04100 [Thermoprotei archaeon]